MSDAFVASYVILWIGLVATLLLTIVTTRQVALLTRRFPFAEVVNEQGPELGSLAPALIGESLADGPVSLTAPFPTRTGFVFVSENCKVCAERLSDLEQIAAEADGFDLWLVFENPPSHDFSAERKTLASRSVVAATAFKDWKIRTVPYSLVVSETGTIDAKGDILNIGRLRVALGLVPGPDQPTPVAMEEKA